MAPFASTLDVTFTSNFAGLHRVCWRKLPLLLYDCSTIVSCVGGGGSCSVSIPITEDNETCSPVTYEGYVQAVCEDVGSFTGRDYFSITFTPVPVCASYRITCIGETCPDQILGTTCNGDAPATISGMVPGESIIACMTELPTIGGSYTFTPAGCCYDCVSVIFHVDAMSPLTTIYYVDCTTHMLVSVDVDSGLTHAPLCVVNNSWYWAPSTSTVTVTVGAPCSPALT